jgi:DNA-binding transcriptional ArsR family regulator
MPNPSVSTASVVPAHLHPNRDLMLRAIGSPLRCDMLAELSCGEPRMIIELARKTGITPAMAGKHLAVLRRAGLVELTRRNYQIPRHFILDAAQGHLDFGHCLLRLAPPAAVPAT